MCIVFSFKMTLTSRFQLVLYKNFFLEIDLLFRSAYLFKKFRKSYETPFKISNSIFVGASI